MRDPANAAIQKALHALGHDPGPADGLFGPRTRRAGEAWLAAGGGRAKAPGRPGPAAAAPRSAIRQGTAGHLVDEIVVHCSATRPDWMVNASFAARVAEIRRWHMRDRGWRDIGYHWVIDRDGALAAGRPESAIGAGVIGHNAGVLHLCLLGGHGGAASDPFARHFTPAQDRALRALIAQIRLRTPIARVSGHNEWAAKACPCFPVPAWLDAA
jgi:hypothetical protein